jgi:phage shock protein PspC (stress-responsive transcriptional regulator)
MTTMPAPCVNLLHLLGFDRVSIGVELDLAAEDFALLHVRVLRQAVAEQLGVELAAVQVRGVTRWRPIVFVEVPAEGGRRLAEEDGRVELDERLGELRVAATEIDFDLVPPEPPEPERRPPEPEPERRPPEPTPEIPPPPPDPRGFWQRMLSSIGAVLGLILLVLVGWIPLSIAWLWRKVFPRREAAATRTSGFSNWQGQKRRSRQHRIVAGVCGGLAEVLGLNATLVRVVVTVLSIPFFPWMPVLVLLQAVAGNQLFVVLMTASFLLPLLTPLLYMGAWLIVLSVPEETPRQAKAFESYLGGLIAAVILWVLVTGLFLVCAAMLNLR